MLLLGLRGVVIVVWFLFWFGFETGFLYVLAVLEHTIDTRPVFSSQRDALASAV